MMLSRIVRTLVIVALLCAAGAGAYLKGHADGLAELGAHATALRHALDVSTSSLTAANVQTLRYARLLADILPTMDACAKIVVDDAALPREPEHRIE